MAGQIIPIGFRALDASGTPYANARLYTFDAAATTTPKASYTTDALSVSHGAYVQGLSDGSFPQAFAAEGAAYYLELRTAAGIVLKTYANIIALGAEATGDISRDFGVGGRLVITGDSHVRIEGGPPVGDEVGGTLELSGRGGTTLDELILNATNVTFGGKQIGEVLLNSGAVTAQATLDVTLAHPNVYRAYRLRLLNLEPATDAAYATLRFDLGSGFLSGGTDYGYSYDGVTGTTVITHGNNAGRIYLTHNGMENTSGFGTAFDVTIYTPIAPDTDNTHIVWESSYYTSGGANERLNGRARVNASTLHAVTVRLLMESGNIARCRWALYGLEGL